MKWVVVSGCGGHLSRSGLQILWRIWQYGPQNVWVSIWNIAICATEKGPSTHCGGSHTIFSGAYGNMRHRNITFLWHILEHAPQNLDHPELEAGPRIPYFYGACKNMHHKNIAICATESIDRLSVAHI
jgi:hypothetical protein